jgi:hypothetical protein
MQWVRARQRDLSKVVLSLFCLAWLQAAAVPCVMADDLPQAPASHHCQYCPPPSTTAADAGHGDTCAYPHAPQVDSRLASSGLFFVVPVATVIATLDAQPIERLPALANVPPGPSGTAFAVRYCRLNL